MQSPETKSIFDPLLNEYRGIKYFLKQLYGEYGLKYIVFSPYLHLSLLYSFATWSYSRPLDFLEISIVLIAVFIGFSSASFAIFMTLNNEEFVKFQQDSLEQSDQPKLKTFLGAKVRTIFIHFILVQTFTLFLLLIFKTHGCNLAGYWIYLCFVPYLFFIYSLSLNFGIIYHLFLFSDTWFKWINTKRISERTKERMKQSDSGMSET